MPDPGATASGTGERAGLVEHAEEQAILSEIRQLDANGLGVRRIAGKLNAKGITNPRTGGRWTHGTVAAILRTVERREAALAA